LTQAFVTALLIEITSSFGGIKRQCASRRRILHDGGRRSSRFSLTTFHLRPVHLAFYRRVFCPALYLRALGLCTFGSRGAFRTLGSGRPLGRRGPFELLRPGRHCCERKRGDERTGDEKTGVHRISPFNRSSVRSYGFVLPRIWQIVIAVRGLRRLPAMRSLGAHRRAFCTVAVYVRTNCRRAGARLADSSSDREV
jgi:hypothetical protein